MELGRLNECDGDDDDDDDDEIARLCDRVCAFLIGHVQSGGGGKNGSERQNGVITPKNWGVMGGITTFRGGKIVVRAGPR